MKHIFIGLFLAIFIVCGFLKNSAQGKNRPQNIDPTPTITPKPKVSPQTTEGVGNGRGKRIEDDYVINDENKSPQQTSTKKNVKKITKDVKIISKPRPNYTELARQNNIQGTVKLNIQFKADGIVGTVTPVKTLPFGLTEQAIVAARKIQFEPAMKKGKPVTVLKILEFSFTIY